MVGAKSVERKRQAVRAAVANRWVYVSTHPRLYGRDWLPEEDLIRFRR